MSKEIGVIKLKKIITVTLLVILLIPILSVAGCGVKVEDEDLTGVYSQTFEALMTEDEGLNSDIEFIAIDTSNFYGLYDIEDILESLKKYNENTIEATFEELKAQGEFDEEKMVLDGALLKISKIETKLNKLVVEASKYRSGTGAIGMEFEFRKSEAGWELTNSKGLWIS